MAESPAPTLERVAALRAEQIACWRRGSRLATEELLRREPDLSGNAEAVLELLYNEVVIREELGEQPTVEEYARRFPQHAEAVRRQFDVHHLLGAAALDTPAASPALTPLHGGNVPSTLAGLPNATLPLPADRPGATTGTATARVGGFEILGELGKGGMGVVYRARQPGLNRLVALKMIHAGHAGREALTRFKLEAEAAARVRHPNIVQIYEVGEDAGRPFVALEYVAGGTLAQRLAGNPLPPRQAAELLLTLARAIHHAHQRGIVHRDLKPANVLLEDFTAEDAKDAENNRQKKGMGVSAPSAPAASAANLVPKIGDFGLAKCLDADSGQTRTGVIMGTPSYMPPEQAEGRRDVGPAADVYALGAILYETLTGRPPFKAATVTDTIRQVVSDDPVPPGRLVGGTPRDLETVCLKCLRKEPQRRYASAEELAEDLRRFLAGEPILARRTPPWERAVKWARRRPSVTALLVLVAAGVVGLLWMWVAFTASLQTEKQHALDQERAARTAQREAEAARKAAEREAEETRKARDQADRAFKLALTAVNQHAQQTTEGKVVAERASNPGGALLDLACAYARTAKEFTTRTDLDRDQARLLADAYADGAVRFLNGAEQIGLFRSESNRSRFRDAVQGDLALLKGRPGFDELVRRYP